jgi:putative spermidine/putrescine transport system substrate-binding protein
MHLHESPLLLFRFILLAFLTHASFPADARETLRILAWDGYADTEIVSVFEQRYDVDIEVTYANSDDDLWYKINNTPFDIFAVNTAELQRYIEHKLVVAIDIENIPNHAKQLSRFQNLAHISGLVHGDSLYAIPFTYSEMGLIFNRKIVNPIPSSMKDLWNPEYQGRVLAFNTSNHNFSLVGLLMGVSNPFAMDDSELKAAARELVKLRRNVLTFYGTPDEAVKLFSRYDIALIFANYGNQQIKALQEIGADIGYIIPKEGALAWLDCWAITPEAKNKSLAEKWINYTLEQSVSERLTNKHGLANTITAFSESRENDKIIWLEPLQEPLKRKLLWDKIISGDSLEKF